VCEGVKNVDVTLSVRVTWQSPERSWFSDVM